MPMVVKALVVAASLLAATSAQAAVDVATLNDPGFYTGAWGTFLSELDTLINDTILDPDGVYSRLAFNLMAGSFAIAVMHALAVYTLGGGGLVDLLQVVVTGFIITIMFSLYDWWTGLFFQGALQLGQLVQQQAIGDDSLLAPAAYISNVYFSFKVEEAGWFDIQAIFELVILGLLQLAVSLASFFVAAWPSLIFGVAKIVGPITFVFLFHERLSSIFDGWLRLYAGACALIFMGRVTLVLICILFQTIFNEPYRASPDIAAVTIGAEDFGAFASLVLIGALSILLLFLSGKLSAAVVGGANLGIGSLVSSGARTAARAIAAAL